MKKSLAVLSIAGLLLTACKSSSDSAETSVSTAETTASDESTTTAPSAEPGPGVTDDTIRIGVTYFDLDKIKDIVNIDWGNQFSVYEYLAAAINDAGGINGRKLELVDAPVNPIDPTSLDTVCTQLTEDEPVFAIIGVLSDDLTTCALSTHATAVVGNGSNVESPNAPWFSSSPAAAYSAVKLIEGLAAEGAFEGKKVGIVSGSLDSLVVDAALEALAAAGVTDPAQAVVDASTTDTAAQVAQAKTFMQRFETDGIDQVITLAGSFVTVAPALDGLEYRPQLLVPNGPAVTAYLVGRSDYSALENMVVGGPTPDAVQWVQPAMQECVEKVLQAEPGREINDPTTATKDTKATWNSLIIGCQTFDLFVALLTAAGEVPNYDTLAAAGAALGEYQVVGNAAPSNYTADAPTGNPPIYLGRWDAAAVAVVWDSVAVGS